MIAARAARARDRRRSVGAPVADRARRRATGRRRNGRDGRPGRRSCAAARPGRCSASHLELFANRRVVIVPAGIGAHAAAATTRCARARRPASSRSRAERALTLGDLFRLWGQPLGAAPPRSRSARSDHVRAYVAGRLVRGDAPRRAADAERADRARARRLRPAAPLLPLPEGSRDEAPAPLVLLLPLAALAGCGGSGSTAVPRRRSPPRAPTSSPTSSRSGSPGRTPDRRLVRDPAAGREAADGVQARPRAAHRACT